jgi:recombinational DNA repair ATPase RecF
MPRLERLDVENFRGVSRPASLIFLAKSLLLFGENGTCKSSFVDALEKLLTGKVSTLDGRASGLSSEKHGPHIHTGSEEKSRISIVFGDPSRTVVGLDGPFEKLPASVRSYLDAAKQNLYILRRRQLLDLIESRPHERYEVIRPFIDLDRVEQVEQGLRQAKDETERAAALGRQRSEGRIRDLERAVGAPLPADGIEQGVLTALREKLSALAIRGPSSIADLEETTKRLTTLLVPLGDIARHSRLAAVQDSVAEAEAALAAVNLDQLQSLIEELRTREAREANLFYEAVLEDGSRWIEEAALTHCPLCEQSIDRAAVIARIRQRLDAVREVVDLRRAAAQQRDQVRERAFSAREALRRLQHRLSEAALSYPEPRLRFIHLLQEALDDLHDALTQDIRVLSVETVRLYADEFRNSQESDNFAGLHDHARAEINAIPSSDSAREILAAKAVVDHVIDLWPAFLEERKTAALREKEAEIGRYLFESAQAARKHALQSFFDELSDDINDIFQKLHPDESHTGVRLEVREAAQKSVSLRADFYDRRSEDPRAYYSEAHLDTLGLSIFLALRRWYRRQRPAFDLLILDDVLTSVDAAHSIRLSELLLTEFKDYQMLITTHDRIWFEHLWDIQARCGMAQSFVNKVIHKWTLDEGPDLREPEDERKSLDRLIQDGSSQEIAAMAGRLLEHTLHEMRYSLRLGVQAKRGELYEIGDLWPAFYATVKREYPSLYERARREMDALDVRWPLRNWVGAHWNTWARNVPRTSAMEFASAVRGLFDLVFCSECRRFVAPSSTPLGQLSCRCGRTIYPAPGKAPKPPVSREELVRSTQGALSTARLNTVRLLEARRAERSKED